MFDDEIDGDFHIVLPASLRRCDRSVPLLSRVYGYARATPAMVPCDISNKTL